MIPYGKQVIDEADVSAVVDVLRSDYLTQGPKVGEFEQAVASYTGAKYAVAMNSATSALHCACLALGLKEGDTLWTSPISFVASANCARYCGADVDFVDIELATGNISASALRDKIAECTRAGKPLPKILVVVHFSGQPADMAEIRALASEYSIKIIEDGAHAIGARYQDQKTGSGQFSDITIFSFHPVKVVTSGEGGMAMTNCAELESRMRVLSSHGITRDFSQFTALEHEPWAYEQQALGFNYRMSELHAALGLSQLTKLDTFVQQRRQIVEVYDQAFDALGCRTLAYRTDRLSAHHLYSVGLPERVDRAAAFTALRELGIGVNVHYIPIYKQPYFKALGFSEDYCLNAERFYESLITLPLHPSMSEGDIAKVIESVTQVIGFD